MTHRCDGEPIRTRATSSIDCDLTSTIRADERKFCVSATTFTPPAAPPRPPPPPSVASPDDDEEEEEEALAIALGVALAAAANVE